MVPPLDVEPPSPFQEAIAMDIFGHNSKAVSRHYTHVSSEAKRPALHKLPTTPK